MIARVLRRFCAIRSAESEVQPAHQPITDAAVNGVTALCRAIRVSGLDERISFGRRAGQTQSPTDDRAVDCSSNHAIGKREFCALERE
jgi:hypothetical protein